MRTTLRKVLTPWLLGVTAGAVVIAASSWAFDWPVIKTASKSSVPLIINEAPVQRETKMVTSYSAVVKKAAPSVVNISSTKIIKLPNQQAPMFADPFFRWYFGDPQRFNNRRPQTQKQYGLGSGVIVSRDGYLITNNHVVDGADEIKVTLANSKKTYDGKIVGRDSKTDIAIVKIEGKDFPAATLADSEKVEVGDVVLAIGSPFGLAQTVTMGIVSALDRSGMDIEEYENFIQTDAAINPGNSGGALLDAEGRVIGINTAILSRTGGSHGVGFAVPINMARQVMEQILEHGKVERGQLGVMMQPVTQSLARQFKVPEGKGVLVSDVLPKSAAEDAGIKPGDVIIEFNGKEVADGNQLRVMVGQSRPGAAAKVTVLREGKEKHFDVSLKPMDSKGENEVESYNNSATSNEDALDGVTVTDIDNNLRSQLRLPPNLKGAVVMEVEADSAAAEAGLREGDVIVEFNRKPIRSAEDAVNASKGLKNSQIVLRVYSQGRYHYVSVDETKKR